MKTTVTSIFFYLLIAFAIWSSQSLWPLFTLILSPVIFESLDKTKKYDEDEDEDEDDSNINNTNIQLNS